MKNILQATVSVLLLTACVQPQGASAPVEIVSEPSRQARVNTAEAFKPASAELLQRQQPVATVNDYARNLVHELMAQHQTLDVNAMVAVTDLTYVDSGLDKGSLFSNHLSEAIIYDLHRFGVPVLDYKATDFIRVTAEGDFVLSRNFEELKAELPIKYVVTGTITNHRMGLLVNARLIQIDNKQVISAARSFVPNHIVQALMQSTEPQQLRLKQG